MMDRLSEPNPISTEKGYSNPLLSSLRMRMDVLLDAATKEDDPKMAIVMLRELSNTFDRIMQHSDKFVIQDSEKIEEMRKQMGEIKQLLKDIDL